jgi:hypothetical protein
MSNNRKKRSFSFAEANEAFASAIRDEAKREARAGSEPDIGKFAMRARCLLKEMRRLFEHRGWDVLPKTEWGLRILRLGADLAWLAAQANPKRSVRTWCRRYGRAFSPDELDAIIAATDSSNKRWTGDQIATVLEVTASDRAAMGFRQIGACDDPNYERRRKSQRQKEAACQRQLRASRSTGRTRGRPPLNLSPEEKLSRKREQNAARARKYRASGKTVPVASRKNPSVSFLYIKIADAFERDALYCIVTARSQGGGASGPPRMWCCCKGTRSLYSLKARSL